MNTSHKLAPYALFLLRVVAGYLYLLHGAAKLFGLGGGDTVALMSFMGLAGVLELVGGTLLVLGLLTRPVAFLLSGMMAVAYFTAHASASTFLFPLQNGGDAAVLFSFVFLYMAAAGGGAFALDNL